VAGLCVIRLCMMVPVRDAVLAMAEQDLCLVSVSQHLGKKHKAHRLRSRTKEDLPEAILLLQASVSC